MYSEDDEDVDYYALLLTSTTEAQLRHQSTRPAASPKKASKRKEEIQSIRRHFWTCSVIYYTLQTISTHQSCLLMTKLRTNNEAIMDQKSFWLSKSSILTITIEGKKQLFLVQMKDRITLGILSMVSRQKVRWDLLICSYKKVGIIVGRLPKTIRTR